MQRHAAEPMTVPELAALVNLSPSRFRDLFSAQTGMGPVEYLQRLRLRRARLLIERTFLTVKEVMALVGYNDPSHFSRDFRREHGVAPSTLRGRGLVTICRRARLIGGIPDVQANPPTARPRTGTSVRLR